MDKQFITMRDGKRIYVEIYNEGHQKSLLMLHGGPGEGCGDLQYQAIKLSECFNIIIFDQRGVLRSDKINSDEPFGLDFLVDDCEELKEKLRIDRWSVLGHSFGGELALLYAIRYPASVHKVIFECPTFHYPASIRSICIKSIKIAEEAGMFDYTKEIREFIDNNTNAKLLTDFMRKTQTVISRLVPRIEILQEVENSNRLENVEDEQWENGNIHFERLQNEGKMNENMMPLISRMKCPSLLIKGKFDPVCFEEQLDFYMKNSINGNIIIFDNSDHRPHDEEPIKFTETITQFLDN